MRRRAIHERAGTPAGRLARRWRSSACAGRGIGADAVVADAGARLHLAGADRAPDRGAAQEHPRRRARDRRAARRARRRRAADARRELADNEALLRARVTQLWQTRMLRTTKLTVADEIENALSLLPRDLPARDPEPVRATSRRRCRRPARSRASCAWANWIGGDRDGNPNVSAADAAHRARAARARRRCATT